MNISFDIGNALVKERSIIILIKIMIDDEKLISRTEKNQPISLREHLAGEHG